MKKVLSDIIHPNQKGFLHGRYIGDNIRQVLETIEYCEISGTPGLVFIAADSGQPCFTPLDSLHFQRCSHYLLFYT